MSIIFLSSSSSSSILGVSLLYQDGSASAVGDLNDCRLEKVIRFGRWYYKQGECSELKNLKIDMSKCCHDHSVWKFSKWSES